MKKFCHLGDRTKLAKDAAQTLQMNLVFVNVNEKINEKSYMCFFGHMNKKWLLPTHGLSFPNSD